MGVSGLCSITFVIKNQNATLANLWVGLDSPSSGPSGPSINPVTLDRQNHAG